ncbi:HEAT repeat domain-containing protein [filamentous cyanobacterium LEGE 11480]|uniref:HEAT repeat domain-containing protein n=1 Tax=Romeriopsis navalis LEGE 11480 TaxID=2777977 RepID=A0A928VKJ0_9CYAN|nr:HEAT repeat domain-containing protein [Romeriopsis navalis]MBE9028225.1 HEAT repeat domain-containing protein [Romeriopsis navalis LEGE 11480]
MTSPDRLQQLETQLRDPALNKRIESLNQLAQVESALAIPILQRLTAEKDVGLRRIAVMGLGNHRTAQSFEVLQDLLDNEADSNIQAEAANSIFEFGNDAIPLLENLFTRSDSWLVKQTIVSLMIESGNPAALHRIITHALQDSIQTVKEAGILGFIRLWGTEFQADALAQITQLTQDPYWRNRWRATTALQTCTDPQAKALLLKMQEDEHFRVVAAALEVLNSGTVPPQDML